MRLKKEFIEKVLEVGVLKALLAPEFNNGYSKFSESTWNQEDMAPRVNFATREYGYIDVYANYWDYDSDWIVPGSLARYNLRTNLFELIEV